MAIHRHAGVAEVLSVVATCMPGYQIGTVVPVGQGLDNAAYEVNGELIVRFSKDPDPKRLGREARLLAAVAAVAPLPVPQPVFTVAEQGCMAYFKLPGTPMLDLPRHHRSEHDTSTAATLGELLTVLHSGPAAQLTDLVDPDDHPLTEWRQEAAATYLTVTKQVPSMHRRPVEAFLGAPPPDGGYTPVFSHNGG